MTDSPPVTINDALVILKKQFPKVHFISSTPSFLTASYQRSPTSLVTVKTTLTFLDGYGFPNATLAVSIEGTNVPPGLKRKLEKELGEVAKLQSNKEASSSYHQVQAVLKRLVGFIDTNHFVPCWKELRQVVDLIKSSGDTVGMNETTGLVKIAFQQGKYTYKCSIKVDPEYPNVANVLTDYGKPCKLKLDSSNFPDSVANPIAQQAQELVRRLQDGMSEEHALQMSNPMHLPSASSKADETPEEAWQRQDQERRKQYGIPLDPPYDGSDPQPSLLPLVKFLHKTIPNLPKQICPGCNEKCLPVTPLLAPKAKQSKPKRPVLVHCGHWYHWGCMDQRMNQPPFGMDASCQECDGKPLYHSDWPLLEAADQRERAYQQRAAREREIADAADFF